MFNRLTPVLLLLAAFALIGCATHAPSGEGRSMQRAEGVAEPENGATPTVQIKLEPGVTHHFTQPVKLSIKYRSIYAGSDAKGEQVSDDISEFDAVAMPLREGETFTLRLEVVGEGEEARALLIINKGAIYVSGSSPAVGGGQTGTHGEGTKFILESGEGVDYVYLLTDNTAEARVFVFKPGQPAHVVFILADRGQFRGYKWLIDGALHEVEAGAINDHPDRKRIHDLLLELANDQQNPLP